MPAQEGQKEDDQINIDMDELKRTVVAFRTKLADYHEVFFDNEFTGVFDQENNIEAIKLLLNYIENSCSIIAQSLNG